MVTVAFLEIGWHNGAYWDYKVFDSSMPRWLEILRACQMPYLYPPLFINTSTLSVLEREYSV